MMGVVRFAQEEKEMRRIMDTHKGKEVRGN